MMRLMLMTCSLLTAAMPALAQTPTVDDLLAKNLESRGGAERLKAISTRRVAGTVTVQVQMPPGAQQPAEAPAGPANSQQAAGRGPESAPAAEPKPARGEPANERPASPRRRR